jgi:hypothetical protein
MVRGRCGNTACLSIRPTLDSEAASSALVDHQSGFGESAGLDPAMSYSQPVDLVIVDAGRGATTFGGSAPGLTLPGSSRPECLRAAEWTCRQCGTTPPGATRKTPGSPTFLPATLAAIPQLRPHDFPPGDPPPDNAAVAPAGQSQRPSRCGRCRSTAGAPQKQSQGVRNQSSRRSGSSDCSRSSKRVRPVTAGADRLPRTAGAEHQRGLSSRDRERGRPARTSAWHQPAGGPNCR